MVALPWCSLFEMPFKMQSSHQETYPSSHIGMAALRCFTFPLFPESRYQCSKGETFKASLSLWNSADAAKFHTQEEKKTFHPSLKRRGGAWLPFPFQAKRASQKEKEKESIDWYRKYANWGSFPALMIFTPILNTNTPQSVPDVSKQLVATSEVQGWIDGVLCALDTNYCPNKSVLSGSVYRKLDLLLKFHPKRHFQQELGILSLVKHPKNFMVTVNKVWWVGEGGFLSYCWVVAGLKPNPKLLNIHHFLWLN